MLTILLEYLVERDSKKFEYNAEMLSENEKVSHLNDVILVGGRAAMIAEEIEDADF